MEIEAEAYAIVDKDGNILNTIVWDGMPGWSPPEGTIVIRCGDDICEIGGTYKDGVFTSPPRPEESHEDMVSKAEQFKRGMLSEAGKQISILQDAVDLDMATEEEKKKLLALKKFRVLLNRVDTGTAPDITWPEYPA